MQNFDGGKVLRNLTNGYWFIKVFHAKLLHLIRLRRYVRERKPAIHQSFARQTYWHAWFVKFRQTFHHQSFALYGNNQEYTILVTFWSYFYRTSPESDHDEYINPIDSVSTKESITASTNESVNCRTVLRQSAVSDDYYNTRDGYYIEQQNG